MRKVDLISLLTATKPFFLFFNVCTGPTLFCEQKNEGKQLFMWPRNAHGLNEITIFFLYFDKVTKTYYLYKNSKKFASKNICAPGSKFFFCIGFLLMCYFMYIWLKKFESQHIKCDQFLSSNKKNLI